MLAAAAAAAAEAGAEAERTRISGILNLPKLPNPKSQIPILNPASVLLVTSQVESRASGGDLTLCARAVVNDHLPDPLRLLGDSSS